jgi:urate oxidase
MATLGANQWGKSDVRISKVLRGDDQDDILDLTVQILLTGDVRPAFIEGNNSAVLPTDTAKNTVYGLAQEHLGTDLEAFATVLGKHFVAKDGIESATIAVKQTRWQRHGPTGFLGGGSERRTTRVVTSSSGPAFTSGIEGLVVLKTTDSAFVGFPRVEFTVLPEVVDRRLATSVTADWTYSVLPADTTASWEHVRSTLLERFFDDWSASVQHQGWKMAEAVFDSVAEISEITFHLPNQHHLAVDLTRFGLPDDGTVFQPVSQPYGDIRFTAHR